MAVRTPGPNIGRQALRHLVADNYPAIARSLLRPLLHRQIISHRKPLLR